MGYSRQLTYSQLCLGAMLLVGCSSLEVRDSGPVKPMDFSHLEDATPRHEERTRAGNPTSYVVFGKRYHVMTDSKGYKERGTASWYGKKFHGRKTSNGEVYNMYAMTAAHKTLPIPSYLQVTNLDNGRSVVVRVNDRGPFHGGRIIDLSYAAASKLGFAQNGTGQVEIVAIEPGQKMAEEERPRAPGHPAAKAPPQAQAQTSVPARTTLYLQLGSFIERDNAEALRAELSLNNVQGVEVERTEVDRNPLYRVRIGPISSVVEAQSLSARLSALGMGTANIVLD